MEFDTTSGVNPYVINGNFPAYDRETDTYTCQHIGAHLFSWSVGVEAGNGVSNPSGVINYLLKVFWDTCK